MFSPYVKFRSRRLRRKLKREFVKPFKKFHKNVDKLIVKKWKKFSSARRFILGWTSLVLLLLGSLVGQIIAQQRTVMVEVPVEGGRYTEGVTGEFDNLNPLYAIDGADAAASRLVFSSLLEYSADGRLVGDVAEEWSGNEGGDTFTVQLREDVYWHDGEQLTAEDVVFTVESMKDPNAGSPLENTWEAVEVEAPDEFTVTFTLPNTFAPFPHLLRFGIVPEHILGEQSASQLRVAAFNIEPVGSGPFTFTDLDEEEGRLLLSQFDDYYGETPKIRRFELRTYEDEAQLADAFENGNIDGYGSTQPQLSVGEAHNRMNSELAVGTYLMFNTSRNLLSDATMRQALTQSLDVPAIRNVSDQELPTLSGMFLDEQLEFGSRQQQLGFKPEAADNTFDENGWKRSGGEDSRQKNGDQLSLTLAYPDVAPFNQEAITITEQWEARGVTVTPQPVSPDEFQVDTALQHDYDAAIVSISNGLDPDVYVFWHSSFARDGGLNFSRISDDDLDNHLEAGRTRIDSQLRREKYKSAAERWRTLAPAVALHQNKYHYVQRSRINGYEAEILSQAKDRFNSVESWTARTEYVSHRELSER